MLGRMFRFCVVSMLAIGAISCGGDSDDSSDRLSQLGEACSKAGECEAGLECWGAVCQQEGAQCPNDMDCLGRECGPDPVCGSRCGSCPARRKCQDGLCIDGFGTWTDPSTGLTWQNPPAETSMTSSYAEQYCTSLGRSWHLPTIGQLRSLIRGCSATESGGTCNVREGDCLDKSCIDGSCDGCSGGGGPADGCYWPAELEGDCVWYWSLSWSLDKPYGDTQWSVGFYSGSFGKAYNEYGVRCVLEAQ